MQYDKLSVSLLQSFRKDECVCVACVTLRLHYIVYVYLIWIIFQFSDFVHLY